jgi:hypothetical protein
LSLIISPSFHFSVRSPIQAAKCQKDHVLQRSQKLTSFDFF